MNTRQILQPIQKVRRPYINPKHTLKSIKQKDQMQQTKSLQNILKQWDIETKFVDSVESMTQFDVPAVKFNKFESFESVNHSCPFTTQHRHNDQFEDVDIKLNKIDDIDDFFKNLDDY